ncbi:hypothetical protein Aduo_005291 [Ancylostoma duodenale]
MELARLTGRCATSRGSSDGRYRKDSRRACTDVADEGVRCALNVALTGRLVSRCDDAESSRRGESRNRLWRCSSRRRLASPNPPRRRGILLSSSSRSLPHSSSLHSQALHTRGSPQGTPPGSHSRPRPVCGRAARSDPPSRAGDEPHGVSASCHRHAIGCARRDVCKRVESQRRGVIRSRRMPVKMEQIAAKTSDRLEGESTECGVVFVTTAAKTDHEHS